MMSEQTGKVDIVNIIVILLLIVACGGWFIFLRPVPIQKATGTITDKYLKPAGEYAQYRSGSQMNYIKTPECYIVRIRIDGSGEVAGYSLGTMDSKEFEVGKRVLIEFKRRGIPLLWNRMYVHDMHVIK